MADLSPEQRATYWRYNVRLTAALLVVWFVVTFLLGGIFASALNEFVVLGFPLGFYMAAQGSLIVFVVMLFMFARQQNRIDREHGYAEED